jgi:glucosamine--fructose-6-phosphate aminotransferase (isomerizing)
VNPSYMRQEIEEIPAAVARLLERSGPSLEAAGRALRERRPVMIATIARGSSDHATSFLKYAFELVAGIPVASIGPSIASIYGRELDLRRCAALAVSQSGKSPDIVRMAQSARASGAYTVALTNTSGSPLSLAADAAIDLAAGEEKSVAATKSFVSSVAAGLLVVAHAAGNGRLAHAVAKLPSQLETAVSCDWSPLVAALDGQRSLYVLGRGPSLAIAQEAALKFKETCGLHAEAYSAAEVLHGPARIVEDGFPILGLTADRDAGESSVAEVVDRLAGQGARAFVTSDMSKAATELPAADTGDALTGALALIVSFYAFVESYARHRGFDPDRPPHLRKVTETL